MQSDLNIQQTTRPDYFLSYSNIEINPETFNTSILNKLIGDGTELTSGTIEALTVEINWTEIFRYWTEIRSKYHLESEESDEEVDQEETEVNEGDESWNDTNSSSNDIDDNINCRIRVTNLVLNLKQTDSITDSIGGYNLSDDISRDFSNTDLIKDFMNHIIGQFRIEISGIKIKINDELTFEVPTGILVTPEVNGLRKIALLGNLMFEDGVGTFLIVKKGAEVTLIRTFEEYKIKAHLPEMYLECIDPFTIFPSGTRAESSSGILFEISVDLVKAKLFDSLSISLNDIFINDSGTFITGHFESHWKERLISFESPVQTHVITGNYKTRDIVINEEISLKIKRIDELEKIKEVLISRTEKVIGKTERAQFKLRAVIFIVEVEEYNTSLFIDEIVSIGNLVTIKSIRIIQNDSSLKVSDISYQIREEPLNANIKKCFPCPFAEFKRFIENDEVVSLEHEELLYSRFSGLDKLNIQSITGIIDLEDIQRYTATSSQRSKDTLVSFIGKVDSSDVSIKVAKGGASYRLSLKNLRLLKTETFSDIRVHLNNLMRESDLLVSGAEISCTITSKLSVAEVNGGKIVLPHNIYELFKSDFALSSESESDGITNLQVTVKGLQAELRCGELQEPVKTALFLSELNYKASSSTVYVDELGISLDSRTIFQSGLLKFDLTSYTLRNHCSELTLTPETYGDLLRVASFWSDVYTPLMEDIRPEAVFKDKLEVEGGINTDGIVIDNSTIQEYDDDDQSSLELEFDIDRDEELGSEISTEDLSILLKDIEEDFFVNKDDKPISSKFNLDDCGFRINLNTEVEGTKFIINLASISGMISSETFQIKVKEGKVIKKDINISSSSEVILNRWQRGPDFTCKYPIEDGNFLNIKSEKVLSVSDEINLMISICPLRTFLDEKTINLFVNFFKENPKYLEVKEPKELRAFLFLNKVKISALAMKMDYKSNGPSSTRPPSLKGAEIVLPRIELRGIKGLEGLGPAILSAWIPELRGKKLTGVLKTGLVPVRTIVNLGGGLVELILLPWQINSEMSAAQTVAQMRKSGKQIGLETLKLSASIAKGTSQILGNNGAKFDLQAQTYPRDFQTGVQQAAQLIIALPLRIQRRGGALTAVPLFILDSAATATGALAKTLQGIQAEFDKETRLDRVNKK